jgi:hypothetical protein
VVHMDASRNIGAITRGRLEKVTSARYEVLMKVQVVCSVTPCLLVNTYISVEPKCLSIRGKVIQQKSTSPKRRQKPADTA